MLRKDGGMDVNSGRAGGRLLGGFDFLRENCLLGGFHCKEGKGSGGSRDRVHRRALDMAHGRRRLSLLDLKQCSCKRWVWLRSSAVTIPGLQWHAED